MEITYEEFIQNILDTRGRFNCGDEYHERHHIVPKCMGGTNDEENLIDLFAREHFEAHRLLALENSDNNELVYAWNCMAILNNNRQMRYVISPEEYEEIKILLHNTKSGGNNPRAKPVVNLTTMKIYPTAGIAEKETGVDDNSIRMCCVGQRQTAGGYLWRYYNDDIKEKIANKYSFPTIEEIPEEKRKKSSDRQKASFQDPTERIKNKDRVKKAYKNPEYHQKQSTAKMGSKNFMAKPVICVETQHVYEAIAVAGRQTHINNECIRLCCHGVLKTAGGLQWKFVYDITSKNGECIPGAITLGIITEEKVLEQFKILNNND
jgi:hypothetical protein